MVLFHRLVPPSSTPTLPSHWWCFQDLARRNTHIALVHGPDAWRDYPWDHACLVRDETRLKLKYPSTLCLCHPFLCLQVCVWLQIAYLFLGPVCSGPSFIKPVSTKTCYKHRKLLLNINMSPAKTTLSFLLSKEIVRWYFLLTAIWNWAQGITETTDVKPTQILNLQQRDLNSW